MKSIFDSSKPIDENNFLTYDVNKLKSANQLGSYRDAVDDLVGIRKTLLLIQSIGRLNEVANKSWYIETLRWLKGETVLSNWSHVPQVVDLAVMPLEISDAFRSFVQQLKNSLVSEPLYNQVDILLKVMPVAKASPISERVQRALDSASDKIDQFTTERMVSIKTQFDELNGAVQSTIGDAQGVARNNLDQAVNNAYQEINQQVQSAVGQVQQAKALQKWGMAYDVSIEELERKLYGRKFSGTIERNASSLIMKCKNLSLLGWGNVSYIKLIMKAIVLIIKNTWSVFATIISKLFCLSSRRLFAFLLLGLGALAMVAMPLLEMFGIVHSDIFSVSSPTHWLTKTAIWLPLVIILSIAYSFVTKNYRIYANMLDQYKHRRTVAETAQGIILSLGTGERDTEVRNAMTSVAAQALFEHKVTGHLSKKEVESLSLMDIVKMVPGK